MVAQRKHAKLSSEAKGVRVKMKALATPDERQEFYRANRAAFQKLEAHEIRGYDRDLLLEIANLHENGWQRLSKNFPSDFQERSILELRNDLRAIWEKRFSEKQSNEALNEWLVWSTQRYTPKVFLPWVPDIRTGRLLPVWENLPARVVMAVLEHYPRFCRCANPDCAVPYFIAKRKSQRFCELGECTRYAQNQYALKWWKEKGKLRTATPERSKRGTRKTR